MPSTNPFTQLLPGITDKPPMIPADTFRGVGQKLDKDAILLLQKAGLTAKMLQRSIEEDVRVSADRFGMYQELERACFVGSTQVYLLNNTTPTLKEMSEHPENFVGKYTLSINPETLGLEPDKIMAVGLTRRSSKLVRVTLDNGEEIDCTLDHKFLLRDGTYKEAQYLQSGDSLMSKLMECLLNHKVVIVQELPHLEDVYCLRTEKNHNFPLKAGVFVSNCEHWFVGPALDLYGNVATTFNPIHNATVWVTSQNDTYAKELTSFLDQVGVEEKIFDWAVSVATFGDLFIKANGVPGIGVISLDDGVYPMHISRVEVEGMLVGFYRTPQGIAQTGYDDRSQALIPPWDYVHFRLLGTKRKRPKFGGDPGYAEMRQIHLVTGGDTKQINTRYGASIALNALPAYKRLRLAEDSLLLARVTRGIIRYIWKMKVDMNNAEAVSSLMDQYATLITQARAIDTRDGSPGFDNKQNSLTAIEDIFVPVWGSIDDLKYEKVGGEADIRWIVDVDNLRNQLAFAMACSPSLGGAFTKESSGALGSEAISELGIRFARSARRLQRSLVSGIVRLCQIHLAYMGMDPDPALFEVHMSETSSTEEAQMMKSLNSGIDSFRKFIETLKKVAGNRIDMLKIWEYFNEKILKMEDFQITDFFKSPEVMQKEDELRKQMIAAKAAKEETAKPTALPGEQPGEKKPPKPGFESIYSNLIPEDNTLGSGNINYELITDVAINEAIKRRDKLFTRRRPTESMDVRSYLPALVSVQDDEEAIKIGDKSLLEAKRKGDKDISSGWLIERDARSWKLKFSKTIVEFKPESEMEVVEEELDLIKDEPEEV